MILSYIVLVYYDSDFEIVCLPSVTNKRNSDHVNACVYCRGIPAKINQGYTPSIFNLIYSYICYESTLVYNSFPITAPLDE